MPSRRSTAKTISRGVASVEGHVLAPSDEKAKLSVTLDKSLVDEIREQSAGRPLSTSINELLHSALAQQRLGEFVDDMIAEAGAPSEQAYERVLAQWFVED